MFIRTYRYVLYSFLIWLQTDSSNSEAKNQFDVTIKMSETAQQAEQAYSYQDYPKAIEYLSSIIEVNSRFH